MDEKKVSSWTLFGEGFQPKQNRGDERKRQEAVAEFGMKPVARPTSDAAADLERKRQAIDERYRLIEEERQRRAASE